MVENVKELLEANGAPGTFKLAREAARKYIYDLRSKGKISFSDPVEGESPTIHVIGRTVPEVWEKTTMALLGIGQDVHTGYDPTTEGADYKGEYISFPSLEGTVMMHISEPRGEPRLHKHFLAGWNGFGAYRAEVGGIHDHWMISPEIVAKVMQAGKFDKIAEDDRWNYTYHQRLFDYPYIDIEAKPQTINQIDSVVNKLLAEPLSKSAQAITWDPRWDHNDGIMKYSDKNGNEKQAQWKSYHSPCLQSFWFRLIPTKNGYNMNVNGRWRSRDHLKAVPQNIFGISEEIFENVRQRLEEGLGVPVTQGRYADINDSLHLYGHYFDPRKQGLDAEAYLQDVFKVAGGEPIENRLILPGSDMWEIAMGEIKDEYEKTKANPDLGRAS